MRSRREAARVLLRAGQWTPVADLLRSEDARIDGDWADLKHRGNSQGAWHGVDPADLVKIGPKVKVEVEG